ncbi:MAG: oligosaccharide flippase family protein [Anaerolineae bacterium]|nr:oligosaccharide flippase family protein [Anaerolineae bacterium]
MIRRRLPDLLIFVLFFGLPLVMFWQQTLGGRTLIPSENLYQYEPYATYREVVSAPEVPHNALVSDLVLQNFQWKSFIRESLAEGEIPLWNPHQFSGIPFMAAGQQSTLYPFSVLYYVLPLPAAYGWFTVVQLWLAGCFMYLFLRGLGTGRAGGVMAGVVYQLSAFFVTSAVFPMIVAAAAWLPLVLLAVEFVVQQRPALRGRPATLPWVVVGAGALGCNLLAGHVEITYYVLLIAGYYAAARLLWVWWSGRKTGGIWRRVVGRGLWLVALVGLGVGLGAIQFIPLFELASMNYRDGSASLEQVRNWAHPLRDVVQFVLPNFYGNPTHHAYWDVFSGQTVTAFTNAAGESINTIDWGIKNYVEGALYLGILPLVLAVYGLVRRRDSAGDGQEQAPPYSWTMAVLVGAGLTFMFGLPTYAILYYGLPGINQLHSPFRWIFAVTLGVAVLAGFGMEALRRDAQAGRTRFLGWGGVVIGGLILAGLVGACLFFGAVEPIFQTIVEQMALAERAFADGRMFFTYQFGNVLVLGAVVVGVGLVFLLARRGVMVRGKAVWPVFAVGLVAADLMIASWGFNPASDPALLEFTPPAIEWLKQQPGEWRYTTVDEPALGERGKIMNANMGWRYQLDDIRGYESIIPKSYVDFMGELAPQVQLEYNRVAPLYPNYQYDAMEMDFRVEDALSSPILGHLNVRYVVTSKQFSLPPEWLVAADSRSAPAWSLAYEDEAVRIWLRNTGVQARAYTVSALEVDTTGYPTTILSDTGREKVIAVRADEPQWLVVSETYLAGWRAFVRWQGASEDYEIQLDVERVRENFQGVYLDTDALTDRVLAQGFESAALYMSAIDRALAANDEARVTELRAALSDWETAQGDGLDEMTRFTVDGYIHSMDLESLRDWATSSGNALKGLEWTVRMNYNPSSFQIGLFGSFISGVLLVFAAGVYLWRLYVSSGTDASGAQVVARNSLAPIILNLFNRGIDFGFAFVMLRILGPEGSGIYTYAAFIFGWFDIFTNFGLNVFLTREVARDPSKAWRYFFNTSVLRFGLMGVGVVLLALFLLGRQSLPESDPLTREAIIAIVLLYIGLLPNSLSTGMSALFYAFQKAEYPAAISTLSTISKAVLGLTALVMGYGVIGLAGVSIITNTITLGVMIWVGRGFLRGTDSGEAGTEQRDYRPERKLIGGMVHEGWPLMLNHFLATIFFQIDVVIIQFFHGDTMVGQYGVAYKWVSALNVIPAFFTMALLPVMSRQAHEDRGALKRNYGLAIKLLVGTAIPVAVVFTFMAYFLTGVLGGSQYLPDGAIATQLMIWSIPVGWINSLTQYVLIALDLQRRITRAFFIAVSFNLIANMVLIPTYGYRAAAITTIFSELMLLIPFGIFLHQALGRIEWARLLWKPAAAGGAMVATLLVGWPILPAGALVVGCGVYVGVLLALRPFEAAELERLMPLMPFKRWTGRALGAESSR